MGKRGKDKTVKSRPKPSSECSVCNDLRNGWSGRITTIDRDKAVEAKLNQLSRSGKLKKVGFKGQTSVYQCSQCEKQWSYDFLDNSVPGWLS